MEQINQYIISNVLVSWLVIVVAFAILAKCADLFVEGSIALAEKPGDIEASWDSIRIYSSNLRVKIRDPLMHL